MAVLCTFKIKMRAKILNMGLPGVKLMHQCINTEMLNEIYKQLIFPKRFHQTAHIRIANSPRAVQCRRSLIYKATHQFNQLPLKLKYTPVKLFKLAVKKCKLVDVTGDQMTNSKQNTSPKISSTNDQRMNSKQNTSPKLLTKHISTANQCTSFLMQAV